MNDKWTLLRLYGVCRDLDTKIDEIKVYLLRYASLVKSNLPMEYRECVKSTGYDIANNHFYYSLKVDNVYEFEDWSDVVSGIVVDKDIVLVDDGGGELLIYIEIQ